MNSRGPPDQLPTGTPHSPPTTLRVHRHRLLLRRPRQRPRLELQDNGTYAYSHVERVGHRNPLILNIKNSTPSSKTPLFGTTPRTPRRAARRRSSSTTPLVGRSPPPPRPTGCCSSRTPPYPTMSPTTPTPSSSSTSALDPEFTCPTSRMHREGQPREEAEPLRPPRATPAGLACPRAPPPRS